MALDNFAERRADGTPSIEDEERVFFTTSDVECVIDAKAGAFGGRGTLYISTKYGWPRTALRNYNITHQFITIT